MINSDPVHVSQAVNLVLEPKRIPCFSCKAIVPHMMGLSSCKPCMDKQDLKWKQEAHYEKINELIERRYIRPSTLNCTFSKSQPYKEDIKAYTKARAWKPNDSGEVVQSVYIQGDIGCGKTYLARCLLNRCLQYKKVRGAELSALEFTEISRQFDTKKYGDNSLKRPNSPTEWLDHLKVLLIDDLDKAPWTDRALSFFWQLLTRRRENKCVTIFTANFPPKVKEGSDQISLEKVLAQHTKNSSMVTAIFDRMLPLTIIEMTGISLRFKQSQSNNEPKPEPIMYEDDEELF